MKRWKNVFLGIFIVLLVFLIHSFTNNNENISVADAVYGDTTPPTVPQNLTSTNISTSSIDLAWEESTDNEAVEGYILYRDGQELATVVDDVYSTPTYQDLDILPETTYIYEVVAFDTSNNVSEKSLPLQITTPTLPGDGIGLKGEYFNSIDFTDRKMVRIDEQVDFDWEGGSPDNSLDKSGFTVRWTGKVEPRFSEIYTFYTEIHGGVRLWVNDHLLVDDWDAHNMVEESGTIELLSGQKYNIKLEYKETIGAANAKLLWSSKNQPKEIIPTNQLYPPFIPEPPASINTDSTSTTISLTWDEVSGAEGYDIEVDGQILDNSSNSTFIHDNLASNSQHTYRLRSKIPGVVGNWSLPVTVTTKIGIPQNLSFHVIDNNITISWDEVPGAESYDIEVDGQIIDNGNQISYVHSGLQPNTIHLYKVRAKNSSSTGDWTEQLSKSGSAYMPTNLKALASSNSITISWDEAVDAIGYDIEVDGQIIDNGTSTSYTHNGLEPNTPHQYRVRARKSEGNGDWTSFIIKSTLPEPGNGIGLKAQYYEDINLTDLKIRKIDDVIDLKWQPNSPPEGINDNNYSAMWTGQVEPRFTEIYTFETQTHGGVRLWVNNQLLFDEWNAHNMTTNAGTVTLKAGDLYDIRLEYNQTNGTGQAELYWSSLSQNREIVPKSQLYPLGTPKNLSTSSTLKTIELSWDDVSYATSYEIEVDGQVTNNGLDSTFTHSNLIPGTLHSYRVRAISDNVIGEWSSVKSQATLLGRPENIALDPTQNDIVVSWDSVEGAVEYDIEVDGTVINNSSNSIYVHKELLSGTLHNYRIRARSFDVTGDWTEVVSKWTLPGIPENFITDSTSTTISIQWEEVRGATGYDVEVYGNPVDNGNSTQYTHGELNPNTQLIYRVRAKNSSGVGKWSEIVVETTLPGIPKNIDTEITDTTIDITWDPSAGATAYDLEVDGEIFEVIVARYLHSALLSSTEHTYRVRAKNLKGTSDWSQLFIKSTQPSTPENLTIEMTTEEISLIWEEVPRTTGYELEIDGEVINNGMNKTYIFEVDEPNTEHTFRVRSKNNNLCSFWSSEVTVITLPETPKNLITQATSSDITVNWDSVIGAIAYEIEVDGNVIDIGLSTNYAHENLTTNTEHTYRVRAKNEGGVGNWSDSITELTLLLAPTNLTWISTDSEITVLWDISAGAETYEITVDGEIVNTNLNNSYIHENIEPNTYHIYRVRSISGVNTSYWSDKITGLTLLGTPSNILSAASSYDININWEPVPGAEKYEIKIDGNTIEEVSTNNYKHVELDSNSTHYYSVRAINSGNYSAWSANIIQVTAPESPNNLQAEATTNQIQLMWEEVEGATAYDLMIDNKYMTKDIVDYSFNHDNLEPNTFHTYKIRAKNQGGNSEWSQELQVKTNPEVTIKAEKDNTFNFVMVVPKKDGVNKRTIVVTYNPEELEVEDLCAITPELDITTGRVGKTNIYIVDFVPGQITYEIENAVKTVVNSIKFISRINGYSKVTYTIE